MTGYGSSDAIVHHLVVFRVQILTVEVEAGGLFNFVGQSLGGIQLMLVDVFHLEFIDLYYKESRTAVHV